MTDNNNYDLDDFLGRINQIRISPYKNIFNTPPTPLNEWEIRAGFIPFSMQMPEKDRQIVLRSHPNVAYGGFIFHYVGYFLGDDLINCSFDGKTPRHYTHYSHWQYKDVVDKIENDGQ